MSTEDRNLDVLFSSKWIFAPPRGMKKYVTGLCYDFALALNVFLPSGEFVALGTAEMPEHTALRLPDGRLVDVRGVTDDLEVFLKGFRNENSTLMPVERLVLERQCGLLDIEPPYRESSDIQKAMADVRIRFYGMRAVSVPRPKPLVP